MITFYPRDIGMWRTVFWFDDGSVRGITLTPKPLPRVAQFQTKNEFFDFLKEHSVRFDDPNNPVKFEDYGNGSPKQAVVQFSCIGWVTWV
jgi:hypothetical protein